MYITVNTVSTTILYHRYMGTYDECARALRTYTFRRVESDVETVRELLIIGTKLSKLSFFSYQAGFTTLALEILISSCTLYR